MSKLKIAFLALLGTAFLSFSSCGNDEGSEPVPTSAEITVKNTAGELQPGLVVYMFDLAPAEPGGLDASGALASAETDGNGVATFDLTGIPQVVEGDTFHFTAIDDSGDEPRMLGTISVVINQGQAVKRTLIVKGEDDYPYGFIPTSVSASLAMSEYQRWRNTQVVACGDGLRVIADPSNETRVEGIGFGMLLAAYAEDKATFDGLHAFYKAKRTATAKNMMAWLVTCDDIDDPGSATDGDIDVAFSLVVASKHWGSAYLDSAKVIMDIIKDNVIKTCVVDGEDVLIVGPGYSGVAWGGCSEMDIMYHTPAFFRVFATVTGDQVWNQLANDTYITLNKGAHPTTGLVPDWQTANGTPGPGSRAGHYGYDACRAPWRITLDYLWNGNAEAEAWAKKIASWANQQGATNIVDGYELDGTPIGANGLNSAFLGGFTVAAMAHSQGMVETFGTELSKLNDNYWFNLNTRVLYLFTLTGNFYDPLED